MLREVALADNQISLIKHKAFRHQTEELKGLDLKGNRLKTIPERALRKIPNLEILNLQSNRIAEVPSKAFAKLGKLQALSLDDNPLFLIHSDAFENLVNLRLLGLSYCPLLNISDSLQKLLAIAQNFSSLDLSQTLVPVEIIANVASLETAILQHREDDISLQTLAEQMELRELDLASNLQLRSHDFLRISGPAFEKVRELDLSATELGLEVLSKFPKLTKLYLNWVPFKRLRGRPFQSLAGHLEELEMKQCGLKHIQKTAYAILLYYTHSSE